MYFFHIIVDAPLLTAKLFSDSSVLVSNHLKSPSFPLVFALSFLSVFNQQFIIISNILCNYWIFSTRKKLRAVVCLSLCPQFLCQYVMLRRCSINVCSTEIIYVT